MIYGIAGPGIGSVYNEYGIDPQPWKKIAQNEYGTAPRGKVAQSAKEWVSFQQIIKCNML